MNNTSMEKDFHELKKEFTDVKTKVDQIHSLLIGHADDEATGILHWKKETEVRLRQLEGLIENAKWFIIGFAAFAGVGVVKVISFVSGFLK